MIKPVFSDPIYFHPVLTQAVITALKEDKSQRGAAVPTTSLPSEAIGSGELASGHAVTGDAGDRRLRDAVVKAEVLALVRGSIPQLQAVRHLAVDDTLGKPFDKEIK